MTNRPINLADRLFAVATAAALPADTALVQAHVISAELGTAIAAVIAAAIAAWHAQDASATKANDNAARAADIPVPVVVAPGPSGGVADPMPPPSFPALDEPAPPPGVTAPDGSTVTAAPTPAA